MAESVLCDLCCFWVRFDDPDLDDDGVVFVGSCRRHAPEPVAVVEGEEPSWKYCQTTSDWFCGEFRREWPS